MGRPVDRGDARRHGVRVARELIDCVGFGLHRVGSGVDDIHHGLVRRRLSHVGPLQLAQEVRDLRVIEALAVQVGDLRRVESGSAQPLLRGRDLGDGRVVRIYVSRVDAVVRGELYGPLSQ